MEEVFLKLGNQHMALKEVSDLITDGHFTLYEQPAQPLHDGLHGLSELLLRIEGPDKKEYSGEAFVRAAEGAGVMPASDRVILKHAFDGLSRQNDDVGLNGHVYSVNISGQSVGGPCHLDRYVSRLFDKTGVPPKNLCFEITETARIPSMKVAQGFVSHMRSLGAHIALDDFGVGEATMSYFKLFKANFVKIDGSQLKLALEDKSVRAWLEFVTKQCHSAGTKVVAEHVESEELAEVAREHGIHYAQGYLYERPHPWPYAPLHQPYSEEPGMLLALEAD